MNKELQNTVILFDIDGTLVYRTGTHDSAGKRAMDAAAFDLTGISGQADKINFAGATDLDVARQLLEMGGVETPGSSQKQRFLELYADYLSQYIKKDSYTARGETFLVIKKLSSMGAVIGIATGNIKKGAVAKLESAGIGDLFNYDLGGYGEDGDVRSYIVKAAIDRTSVNLSKKVTNTVVVGDTPYDVEAAHSCGAKCIGIPFGKNTDSVLIDCGADLVVNEINDKLIEAILELSNITANSRGINA